MRAKILAAAATVVARSVDLPQPCNSDAVAGLEAALRTRALDQADDLVTGDDPRMFRRKIALGEVQIRPADAARDDAHENLAVARNRRRLFDQTERIVLDRSGPFDDDRAHLEPVRCAVRRLLQEGELPEAYPTSE